MKTYNLSQATVKSIRKKELGDYFKNLCKALLFNATSVFLLIMTKNELGQHAQKEIPSFWGWIVFALLFISSVFLFRLYTPFQRRAFRGKVVEVENSSSVRRKDGLKLGPTTATLISVDVCTVFVQNEKGKEREFCFEREAAGLARKIFLKNDSVYFPPLATYPFNESRELENPFCLCCGYFGAAHEEICPSCKVFLAKYKTEDSHED